MNLHQLVKLRNELSKSISSVQTSLELDQNIHNLSFLVNNYPPTSYTENIQNIINEHYQALEFIKKDIDKVQNIINDIDNEITSKSQKFFLNNYHVELEGDFETDRSIRKMEVIDGVDDFVMSRINLHSTFKYPALEIGCKEGKWTKFLVASDPLYITDRYNEFIEIASSQFTPEYRLRLRPYLIKNNHVITGLPSNQFGFIFSYNFFNYLSIDSIKQFLIQGMEWLRPGGSMFFTYNNCDLPAAAAYADCYFMSYVPKRLLIPLCESLGYTITETYDHEPAFSWIEIKKPGQLHTIKAHQTLGEIKYM